MLKRYRLYVELSYEARKQARQDLMEHMAQLVEDVMEGKVSKIVLVDYLTDEESMDRMLLSFVFDDEGKALCLRHDLSDIEVEHGMVSIESMESHSKSKRH